MIDLLTPPTQYPRAAAPPGAADPRGDGAPLPSAFVPLPADDTVRLSEASRNFDASPAEVDAKVARIKAMIADDSYLTDDKIDAVVDNLHKNLCGQQSKKRLA